MTEVWGDLSKSADDPSTIDQEIAALIADHEADPDSHLEVGESLQSHKASEIIDHLARSVVRDKLAFDRFTIDDHFSTIDAWTKSAEVYLETLAQVTIGTLASTNDVQYMYAVPLDSMPNGGEPGNYPSWQCRLLIPQITNQLIHFGQISDSFVQGVGFKISNGSLYAVYYDGNGDEQATEITGYTLDDVWHNYRYEITAGYNINFYVDDNLEVAVTGVTIANYSLFALFRIKTLAAAVKLMYIQQLHFDEDYS